MGAPHAQPLGGTGTPPPRAACCAHPGSGVSPRAGGCWVPAGARERSWVRADTCRQRRAESGRGRAAAGRAGSSRQGAGEGRQRCLHPPPQPGTAVRRPRESISPGLEQRAKFCPLPPGKEPQILCGCVSPTAGGALSQPCPHGGICCGCRGQGGKVPVCCTLWCGSLEGLEESREEEVMMGDIYLRGSY